MGNDASKTKASKLPKPAVQVRGKTLNGTKYVLILHNHSCEMIEYFCDAVNQVKPPGCVAVASKNIVNLGDNNGEEIKTRTSQWLKDQDHVVIICLSEENPPRQLFIDNSGNLHRNIFAVSFGIESPLGWSDAFCIGVEKIENVKRPNDFEGEGLDTLVAAIRGSP